MPLYPCYFCNKYFSQKGNLRNHLRKKYKCEFKKYDIAGHITLTKGERSKLATLASEIL